MALMVSALKLPKLSCMSILLSFPYTNILRIWWLRARKDIFKLDTKLNVLLNARLFFQVREAGRKNTALFQRTETRTYFLSFGRHIFGGSEIHFPASSSLSM